MTNPAPTTTGYKPNAPLSTLIKSHGTGDEAEEVVQSRRQKAMRMKMTFDRKGWYSTFDMIN
jgi:hypothetical protein